MGRGPGLAVALAVMVSGCGNDVSEQDARDARGVLTEWARAFVSGNGERACGLLTAEMERRWTRRGEACPVAVARFSHSDDFRVVREVRVDSDLPRGRDSDLYGVVDFARTGSEISLREVDGRWLIDRDILCIVPDCGD